MITFRQKGDFSKLTRFLEKAKHAVRLSDLDKYGREGVAALASATPVDSGLTATSWYYEITNKNGVIRIEFCNSNVQSGVPIAIILQYGHATGTGGWVEGRDYINPSVRPLFDKIADSAWREHGLPGLEHNGEIPQPGESLHKGYIGYHRRHGMHFLSRYDWNRFMEYMRLHAQP